ncbi:primosomal replication protein N [Ectothiorhodospiraceae bacterium WFHF3C12]|nr:primosomal replication protein N [Ectothiorhodospiraceae bacterium WFHF3C12]
MAGQDAVNALVLVGELVKPPQIRYSPAGVPIARAWLEHRSTQNEGGRGRSVALRIEVRLTGKGLCQALQGVEPGQALRVDGHLARADQRGEPGRLILVAENIELIDRTN